MVGDSNKVRFVVAEPLCWLKCLNYNKCTVSWLNRHYCAILFSHSPTQCFCPSSPNKILSDVLKFDQFWRFQLKKLQIYPKNMFLALPPPPRGITTEGAECPTWQQKIAKKWEKERENQENGEKEEKIGKVLSLCPSWQIGLVLLLCPPPPFWSWWPHWFYVELRGVAELKN